jgi:DNA-3-methyladenine glycosylase I
MEGKPKRNRWRHARDIPTSTSLSDTISKELKKIGFRFVGTTICYAFMQASGMVNDHLVTCPRHAACSPLAKSATVRSGRASR